MRSTLHSAVPRPELWVFAVVLLLCNTHLFTGGAPAGFSCYPDMLTGPGLAYLLVQPFAHVSWYHLILDTGAFFLLYAGLLQKRPGVRLFYLASCAAASLAAGLALSPLVRAGGLYGLSGVCHGLMAVSALEMMAAQEKRLGALCLGLVVVKSVFEVVNGEVLFASLHVGWIGTAVPAAHLGGVLGGLAAYGIATGCVRLQQRRQGHEAPEPDLQPL